MSEYAVKGCECVSNATVYGLDESIKRAKFPMSTDVKALSTELTKGITVLAQSDNGAGHDQWLTGVVVQFDLTFSNKAWVEAERYHFFDFVSSQSTMHRIARFDLNSAYSRYVDKRIIEIMKEKIRAYNELRNSLDAVVTDRDMWKLASAKLDELYLEILYSNPCGFTLTAGMTTNYRQLKTIYSQRKNHRLPEWREFCAWVETLPHSDLITGAAE